MPRSHIQPYRWSVAGSSQRPATDGDLVFLARVLEPQERETLTLLATLRETVVGEGCIMATGCASISVVVELRLDGGIMNQNRELKTSMRMLRTGAAFATTMVVSMSVAAALGLALINFIPVAVTGAAICAFYAYQV